jgi:hypothetical protein
LHRRDGHDAEKRHNVKPEAAWVGGAISKPEASQRAPGRKGPVQPEQAEANAD